MRSMDSSKSWSTGILPQQIWKNGEKWNDVIRERLSKQGETLEVIWPRKDQSSHQHINTHPRSVPQCHRTSVSGNKQWMPSPTWRVAHDQPRQSHVWHGRRAALSLQGHPHEDTDTPRRCIYSLVSPLPVSCQIAELVAPRTAAREEWKGVTGACGLLLAQAHVIIASHETGITEVPEQTETWDFPWRFLTQVQC